MKKINIELNIRILNEDDKEVGNIQEVYSSEGYDNYDFLDILKFLNMIVIFRWARIPEYKINEINELLKK